MALADLACGSAAAPNRTLYQPWRAGRGPRIEAGLGRRLAQLVPAAAWVDARLAFGDRFDRAVERVEARGGTAVDPDTARLAFGNALRIEIAPSRITRRLGGQIFDRGRARRTDCAFLDAGDWRAVLHPLSDSVVHGEILALCRRDGDVRDFGRYRRLAERVAAGETIRRSGFVIDSPAALDRYFAYYRRLVDGIATHGLTRRRRADFHFARAPWRDWIERDISVAVAADGSFVHHGPGRHRLAAAIGLELPTAPVEVNLVHVDWLCVEAARRRLRPSDALGPALHDLSRR